MLISGVRVNKKLSQLSQLSQQTGWRCGKFFVSLHLVKNNNANEIE